MATEIERRFLVKNETWRKDVIESASIKQYYLGVEGACCSVRLRLMKNKAFLTIKGRSKSYARSEFEYEIPYSDAIAMRNELKVGYGVEKKRYEVRFNERIWVVDVFSGLNAPLVIAEIEFDSHDTSLEFLPPFIGQEISDDHTLSNAALNAKPYSFRV